MVLTTRITSSVADCIVLCHFTCLWGLLLL